jgi:transcriptional regulator with XRE-family HTH domain
MHRFRTSLNELISSQGWTQQSFANRLGTDPANVSRWLSGKSTPDSTTIGKILECLPDDYQSDMLTAYLRDQIPPRFEPLVQIATRNGGKLRLEEGAPELPEALGPELRKQVVFFAKLALRWQEVRKILELFYSIAHKGKPARLKKLED